MVSHLRQKFKLRQHICIDILLYVKLTLTIYLFLNVCSQPNCETRKWNVLGEIRVGIFAKEDILKGTELGYDYNFEWYGGAKVRCLCGAVSCSGFLGAKSRGFQVNFNKLGGVLNSNFEECVLFRESKSVKQGKRSVVCKLLSQMLMLFDFLIDPGLLSICKFTFRWC